MDKRRTRDMANAEDGRRGHDACMLSYGARKDLRQPDLACGAGCGDRIRGSLAVHEPQRQRATLQQVIFKECHNLMRLDPFASMQIIRAAP